MASLREIKGKIRAVNKTRQVTRAMEAVSAAKMRRSQERALLARPYAVSSFRLLRRISESFESQAHPFLKSRELKKAHIVVITSDRGLAGSLNSGVLKRVVSFMKERSLSINDVAVTTIGKKGYEYFSKRGYTVLKNFEKLEDAPSIETIQEISSHVISLHNSGEYDHTYVAYSNFVSTFFQEPMMHKILPIAYEDIKSMVSGIIPVKGKYSELFKGDNIEETKSLSDYIFEPSPEKILEQVVFDLVTVILFHGFIEEKASEYSARMVAMRSASDKALEKSKELTVFFNKARQAGITREVSEIVGGIEALTV